MLRLEAGQKNSFYTPFQRHCATVLMPVSHKMGHTIPVSATEQLY
jgi:hypothetical protein